MIQRFPADDAGIPLLQHPGIRNVAVFRALRLGDMLCAVPALRTLRAALPGARITLVGLPWAAQFVSRFQRYIDDFVAFPGHPQLPEQAVREELLPAFYEDMRARRFDLALQMHGSGQISNGVVAGFGAARMAGFALRGRQPEAPGCFVDYPASGPEPLRLLALLERLGAAPAPPALEFPLAGPDHEELQAAGLGADRLPRDYVCIHPGASTLSKCWPAQRFAQVADAIAHRYRLAVVLTGSDKETGLAECVAAHMRTRAINAAGPISIGAMAGLMRGARLLVCNDTGVSHIAAAFGLPSVVVFGDADMARWSPLDRALHRCVHDPHGRRAWSVLRHAFGLLNAHIGRQGTAPAPAQSPPPAAHLPRN